MNEMARIINREIETNRVKEIASLKKQVFKLLNENQRLRRFIISELKLKP